MLLEETHAQTMDFLADRAPAHLPLRAVFDQQADFGVPGAPQGPLVDVGRADDGPLVVDDQQFGVHVDYFSLWLVGDDAVGAQSEELDVVCGVDSQGEHSRHEAVLAPADRGVLPVHDHPRDHRVWVVELAREAGNEGNDDVYSEGLLVVDCGLDAGVDFVGDLVLDGGGGVGGGDEELVFDVEEAASGADEVEVGAVDGLLLVFGLAADRPAAHRAQDLAGELPLRLLPDVQQLAAFAGELQLLHEVDVVDLVLHLLHDLVQLLYARELLPQLQRPLLPLLYHLLRTLRQPALLRLPALMRFHLRFAFSLQRVHGDGRVALVPAFLKAGLPARVAAIFAGALVDCDFDLLLPDGVALV